MSSTMGKRSATSAFMEKLRISTEAAIQETVQVPQESGKRGGKLADFFGVAKQKEMDEIHGIIKMCASKGSSGKVNKMMRISRWRSSK